MLVSIGVTGVANEGFGQRILGYDIAVIHNLLLVARIASSGSSLGRPVATVCDLHLHVDRAAVLLVHLSELYAPKPQFFLLVAACLRILLQSELAGRHDSDRPIYLLLQPHRIVMGSVVIAGQIDASVLHDGLPRG